MFWIRSCQEGALPNLARLRSQGASGTLDSVFPPLSPVAWTGVMTGKNSGKHGVFEFLEYGHDPLKSRVNSVAIDPVRAGLGDRGPPRQEDRRRGRADELSALVRPGDSPASTWATSSVPRRPRISPPTPCFFAELERVVGPYRPWSTADS